MPMQKKKSARGIPRSSRSTGRAARHGRYWARCTCTYCPGAEGKTIVFKSPRRKASHAVSGHTLFPAQRRAVFAASSSGQSFFSR